MPNSITPSFVNDAPAWDNSSEYPSLSSSEFGEDFEKGLVFVNEMELAVQPIADLVSSEKINSDAQSCGLYLTKVKTFLSKQELASSILNNLNTYVNCELSVNTKNSEAKQWSGKIRKAFVRYSNAFEPLNSLFSQMPEEWLTTFLSDEQITPWVFQIQHTRKLNDQRLPLEGERLLTTLETTGHHAWSDLYNQVASSLKIEIKDGLEIKSLGVATGQALLQSPDSVIRENAWNAIQRAWKSQEDTCATIINSLAGWRIDSCKVRSKSKPIHFLDEPLHSNWIKTETLETLMDVLSQRRNVGQRALRLSARALGKDQLDPWDLQAAPPMAEDSAMKFSFEDAIAMIRDSFHRISPEMGDFVSMMHRNRWIEARQTDLRKAGANSPKFAKSRTPRVFMTFTGTMGDIRILAHELGHAFHFWIMRDMPLVQSMYPLTLAETASVFAEFAFADFASSVNGDRNSLLESDWTDAQSIALYLTNIPARFEFEKAFYEQRAARILTAKELNALMGASWQNWYGNTLTKSEEMFWASKAHFYTTKTSFYNFPYMFGYLFSVGVFSQQERFGNDFCRRYISLLRDTGSMTAEALAAKHLGTDISKPKLWEDSLDMISRRLDAFEGRL